MSVERLTKAELAERFGESLKQIQRYVSEGMPHGSGGTPYNWHVCRAWRDKRIRRLEKERLDREKPPIDFDMARGRKMEAEAREAELRVEQMLGTVVPLAVIDQIVGKVCGRMLPILQNVPSNYGLQLEKVGVKPEDAERVLESIATDLTRALQSTADDHEAEASADESDEADKDDRASA
jgi:phage terminase Nu1 subunit (DNA packaging protein)